MKKRAKYISDEEFSELKESLGQALQHARGERDDLRVTVLAVPPNARAEAKAASPKKSLKQTITNELESLSNAELKQVAEYVAFLKFRERTKMEPMERRAAV